MVNKEILKLAFEAGEKYSGNLEFGEYAETFEMWYESLVKKSNDIHNVSNPLPTKEEVIAEGNKQIEDWLSENHYKEQRAYRVAFRRSYEYVLRFIK